MSTPSIKPVPLPVPVRTIAHEMSVSKIPANAQMNGQSVLALMSTGALSPANLSSTLMFSAATNYSG